MNKNTLLRIQQKNPNYSLEQIETVINAHIGALNFKIAMCQKLSLTIPKVGRIHTHGNVKNKSDAKKSEYIKEYKAKEYRYSDKELLF